ncbi:MAG: tRNA (N6-isopentenyl adenosine(37)-C2)-methylthiotransferase MiaB [Bacteroidales bacterium]|nr:tRNA (N6-isopentenyl adenosine(37)-C2)-methylthiotransferase MiaB [Bacteroidales bacterium]
MKDKKKVYIETYGCQMNFSDSEIVASLMQDEGYELCEDSKIADVVFVNTCSIRDHAEQRVLKRLRELKSLKRENPFVKIGVLGCMAERLQQKLLEKEETVDLILGPDAYRALPSMLDETGEGKKAINVILSSKETYEDIDPVRLDRNGITAFISIMRGCENFCSYCVVPYTRGRERSRKPETILREAKELLDKGYREVTLLGQNVNSYAWSENGKEIRFYELLEQVAAVSPLLRVRFATSHPKDISDELLQTIGKHQNICNAIHLPVQSGSNNILKLMNRKYTREWYLDRIAAIRKYIPGCAISTDIIAGFCSETEQDHNDTISIMREVGYDYAFMFKYSERPDTLAQKRYKDDVPEEVKSARLQEIIDLQQKLSHESNKRDIGQIFEVLVEGHSKKSTEQLMGRNSQNKVVVFPKEKYQKGDYVMVKITDCTPATLIGKADSTT